MATTKKKKKPEKASADRLQVLIAIGTAIHTVILTDVEKATLLSVIASMHNGGMRVAQQPLPGLTYIKPSKGKK